MRRRKLAKPTKGSSLFALAVSGGFFVLFAHLARWTTFDCDEDVCVYESRRVLTLPFLQRRTVPRHDLAEQRWRVSSELVDRKAHTADLVVKIDGERLRVEEGGEREMEARVEAFRLELADRTRPIHASVDPHPFGFLVLGVLSVLVALASSQAWAVWREGASRR